MAMAAKYKGESDLGRAIIGDGAMTAGLAFEGMNMRGRRHHLLIIPE